jgi:hypothetical protein
MKFRNGLRWFRRRPPPPSIAQEPAAAAAPGNRPPEPALPGRSVQAGSGGSVRTPSPDIKPPTGPSLGSRAIQALAGCFGRRSPSPALLIQDFGDLRSRAEAGEDLTRADLAQIPLQGDPSEELAPWRASLADRHLSLLWKSCCSINSIDDRYRPHKLTLMRVVCEVLDSHPVDHKLAHHAAPILHALTRHPDYLQEFPQLTTKLLVAGSLRRPTSTKACVESLIHHRPILWAAARRMTAELNSDLTGSHVPSYRAAFMELVKNLAEPRFWPDPWFGKPLRDVEQENRLGRDLRNAYVEANRRAEQVHRAGRLKSGV